MNEITRITEGFVECLLNIQDEGVLDIMEEIKMGCGNNINSPVS